MGLTCSRCCGGPQWANLSGEAAPLRDLVVVPESTSPAIACDAKASFGRLHQFSVAVDTFRIRGLFAQNKLELRLGISWGGNEQMLTASRKTQLNTCEWDDSFQFSSSIASDVLAKPPTSDELADKDVVTRPLVAAAATSSASVLEAPDGAPEVDIASELQAAQNAPDHGCLVLTCFVRRPYGGASAHGEPIFHAVGTVKVPLRLVMNGPIHHEFSLHGPQARDWRLSYNVRMHEVSD
jgi:hypothetical protein